MMPFKTNLQTYLSNSLVWLDNITLLKEHQVNRDQ